MLLRLLRELYRLNLLWLIAIEDDYTGPKLDPDGKVTVEFTEQLMETYKEQQKLHRRYAYQVFYIMYLIVCLLFVSWFIVSWLTWSNRLRLYGLALRKNEHDWVKGCMDDEVLL